jgi:hypothetical protein
VAVIVTVPSVQSASPVQASKIDPGAGVAASVTSWPVENGALQVSPQSIPAGLLVTVPLPVLPIVNVKVWVNVAMQLRAADMVTAPSVQSPSPVQPPKIEPAPGAAASVTTWPETNEALHVLPQVIADGVVVTMPVPLPVLMIDSVNVCVNVAVQLRAADMVTLPSVQSASPVQPSNVDPNAGVAVSVAP